MSKVLAFVLLGKDKLTPVVQKAGVETEKHAGVMSASFSKVGVAMAGMAAIAGPAIKDAIGDAQHSNVVAAQTAAVLKSTGDAAHVTSDQIGKLASTLMFKTGVDDEAIRSGANMLLTFTNIKNAAGKNNDIFNQSTQTLLDMTSAMNGGNVTEENMRKTAVMMGKALNDPLKGMSALQRVGVTFTAQQKEQIKTMVASGNTMGAQKIILGELKKEFGGSAAAVATPFQKLKTSMGELSETIGGILLPQATKLANWGVKAVQWFTNLPAPVQKFSVALLGIAAVSVPMIIAMGKIATGFSALSKAAKAFGIASKLAALGNPWVLLAVAIVAVAIIIVKNWNTIKHWGQVAFNAVLGAGKAVWTWLRNNWPTLVAILTGPLGVAVLIIVRHWGTIRDTAKKVLDAIKTGAKLAWDFVANTFKSMWNNVLRPAFLFFFNTITGIFGKILHGAAVAFGWIPGIGGKLKEADKKFQAFRDNVNHALSGINNKKVSVGVAMTASTNPYPGGISGRAATGGRIRGPGGPTSDRAGLFALSNDEWVIKASSARGYGPAAMNAINQGRAVVGFAGGGSPGLDVTASAPSGQTIGHTIWNSVVATVKKAWASAVPASVGAGGGAGVARWAGVILQALALLGQSSAWLGTVERRMNQESGGNPTIVNRWDSNWLAGHPSVGLMQVIAGTFASYAGPFRGTGPFLYGVSVNPLANTYSGLHYALGRYGSLAALNRPGGYDSGGWLMPGLTMAYNGTGSPERVLGPGQGTGNSYTITINPTPLARPADIGREVVGAIREYEKGAGKGWRS